MQKKHIWIVITILYCAAIFITTASPSMTGNSTKSFIAEILKLTPEQAATLNFLFRKSVHLCAFGVLALLIYQCFDREKYVWPWILTIVYAATDELHQAFIPSRTGSIIDVGIDSLGAIIALTLARVYMEFRKSKLQKEH